MTALELMAIAYLAVAIVTFVFGLFVCERTVGRVCTGETDFEQAFFLAAAWPLVLVSVAWVWWIVLHEEKPKKK